MPARASKEGANIHQHGTDRIPLEPAGQAGYRILDCVDAQFGPLAGNAMIVYICPGNTLVGEFEAKYL